MIRGLKLFGIGAALGLLALFNLAAGSIGTAQKVITVCSSGCDFTSIQAAINSAPEGSTIQVKAGTYQENLVITKSLTLLGQGKEQTIIKGEEEGKPVIRIESAEEIEVTLEGLTIAEAKYAVGIEIGGKAKVTIKDSTVSGNWVAGLTVRSSANVSLQGSTVSGNVLHGLAVGGSANVSLTNSTVSGNLVGLYVWDSANVSLVNSTVSGNGFDGLEVGGSANVSLVNSTVSGNGFDGLRVESFANVSLQSSQVSGNGFDGLRVESFANVSLQGSTVSGNGWDGLDVDDSAKVSLQDSTVSGNGDAGLIVGGSAKAELKGSVIKENKGCGIFVGSEEAQVRGSPEIGGNGADLCGYAPASSLRKPLVPQTDRSELLVPQDYKSLQEAVDAIAPGGTIIVEAGIYQEGLTIWKPLRLAGAGREQTTIKALPERKLIISIIAEAQDVVLEGLRVTGSQGDGLLIYGSAELQNIEVSGNGYEGLSVRGSANVSLQSSTVSGNGDDGLIVWGSANVSLTNSTVSGNGSDGLYVMDSANVTIKGSTIEKNGTDEGCAKADKICNGIWVRHESQTTIIDSIIRNNTDWGVAAWLKKCGYAGNYFTGKVEFLGTTVIEGNNTSGNQNGMGNPGNHPWNQPGVPDGQVCLP